MPAIPPEDPVFCLVLGGIQIAGRVTPKAARKLAAHPGGAVLQGRLMVEDGKLSLADAGFQFIEPRAAANDDRKAAGSEQLGRSWPE